VTALQAERLSHAENQGELRLLLRNDLDVDQHELTSIALSDLRRKLEAAKPKVRVRPPPEPETKGVLIITGDQTTEVKTDGQGRVLD